MWSDEDERADSAVQLILSTEPTDDAGAQTADLFEWQAAMGAADGLAMYRDALDSHRKLADGGQHRILCEYHEDWVTLRGDQAELVSAKHKEPAFGAYTTLNQLLDKGGIAHLFVRWLTMQETATCRLVTTAGLAAGSPQDLEKACNALLKQRLSGKVPSSSGEGEQAVTDFAKALLLYSKAGLPKAWKSGQKSRPKIPTAEQRAQVARFLSMLTLQHGCVNRVHLPDGAPRKYVQPVLISLGLPDVPAAAVWEAVLTVFRVRMRAAEPKPEGGLPKVMGYPLGTPLPTPAELERELSPRIVTLGDIDVAVRTAIAQPGGFLPLPPIVRTSRLAIKMAVGQCADTSIERAEDLRLAYQSHWRERASGDPTAARDKERQMRMLLKISDHATAVARTSDAAWGAALWEELQARLETLPSDELQFGMDIDLLLGGICDLASRCKVWFSPGFDIDAQIALARARIGAGP